MTASPGVSHRRAAARALNGLDFQIIDASIRGSIEGFESLGDVVNPSAIERWKKTLDKLERINQTGNYSIQGNGKTLREVKRMWETWDT